MDWRSKKWSCHKEKAMGLILLLILLILLVGALPSWTYSRQWGYLPSGILGFLILLLITLVVLDLFPLL
jgi:hypothetical protein